MTSAYVLIVAILLLGGVLAVLGDRIGTKVGKARLRLFKLRPRNTATVITVITGVLISALSLMILFVLSESLRDGVFRLDAIRRQLRIAQSNLNEISAERTSINDELEDARLERSRIERSFREVQRRYASMTAQAKRLSAEVEVLRAQRERLLGQIPRLQQQVRDRDDRIASQDQVLRQRAIQFRTLQAQQGRLQSEISSRDGMIRELDGEIAQRDQVLSDREATLEDLTKQLNFLREEVATLEQFYQDYQALRQGNVALVRGEVLSYAVLRIVDPNSAYLAIDQLLSQANRRAIEATRPFNGDTVDDRVVQISQAQVSQLAEQIQDGQDYVVRILSAGNFVEQEQSVFVFADAVPNQQIFEAGQAIATVSVDSDVMTTAQVRARLDTLLAAAQFRARRSGVIGDIQIGDGSVRTFANLVEWLESTRQPFEQIQAVVSTDTYTAGPLSIDLLVFQDGQLLFRTAPP
jgi:uncharacterized protein (DUF3084 family)